MNKYELTLVVNGKIDEESRVSTIEKVKGYLEKFGASITNIDEWGKKRLAYEINNVREGFYYLIHFESDSTVPIELEKRLRIMEQLVRFLLIRPEI